MEIVIKTDIRPWQIKSKRIQRSIILNVAIGLKVVATALHSRAVRNLAGPHYPPPKYKGAKTGEMPVPRVTSLLARSLKLKKISEVLYVVFADSKVAAHAPFVHDGTKNQKPRRFLGDPVNINKNAWLTYLKSKVLKGITDAQR